MKTAPLPRDKYVQQTGSTYSYSGITFDYDDSNATTESFPAGFVNPSDPDDQFAAPDPEQWIAFEGKAPVLALTGTCAVHVDEYQDCARMDSNLFASVTVTDGEGNVLGETTVNETYPLGMPINVGDTYAFLPNGLSTIPSMTTPLMITGEHENDYIQFTLGSLSWKSRTTTGVANCTIGGWDPKDGPICGQRYGDQNAVCSRVPSALHSTLPRAYEFYPKRKTRSSAKSPVRPSREWQQGTYCWITGFERAIIGSRLV